VEVKIGVQQAQRELTVDVEDSAETIEKLIEDSISGNGVIALTDTKGRRVIVPVAKLAYVEIGSNVVGAVGFRS
jgi:hypothetical protein